MSVDFEPVKLVPRRRRLDPVLIGAVVVAVALVAAVLKPWEPHDAAGVPAASAVGVASAVPNASDRARASASAPSATLEPGLLGTPTWAEVAPAVATRDEWGVRAIVADAKRAASAASTGSYTERWFPISPSALEATFSDSLDRQIVALGITFPPEDAPVDLRISRVHDDGRLEWVDAHPIDPVPSGGAFLFVRPGTADEAVRPWGPGRYLIDVLVDGAVRRIAFGIPPGDGSAVEPDRWPIPEPGLVDPSAADPSGIQIGMFATVDGSGVPLTATPGPMLDAAGAWLDVDPATGRAPRSYVARSYQPRATGLGVMLTPGSTVRSASLERLAPDATSTPPTYGGGLSNIHSRQPYVVFTAPDGEAWTPGVYQITVDWLDAAGSHTDSWHAELDPGPLSETPRLLAAVRSWARYAGASGLVLGSVEPVEGVAPASVIQLLPARAEDLLSPVVDDTGCGRTRVPDEPGVVGFAYPADGTPAPLSVALIDPSGQLVDQPLLSVGPTLLGLAVSAPAASPTFDAGTYIFAFGDGPVVQRLTVCFGGPSGG